MSEAEVLESELERFILPHLHRFRSTNIAELRQWMAECRKSCNTWPLSASIVEKLFGEEAALAWVGIPSEDHLQKALDTLHDRGEVEKIRGSWRLTRIGALMRRLEHVERETDECKPPTQ